ncbi:MAG: GxxExxY protein [Bacillariaceae sp.]|jgi:GxxExxY protein
MKKISSPSPQRRSSASTPQRRPSSASKPSRSNNVNRVARDDDDDVNNEIIGSMRNLSLINKTSKVEYDNNIIQKVATKFHIGSFVHQNLITWTKDVFTNIGPNKKEISYHIELKRLLLSKGFDVGYEVPLKYERQGEKAVIRRVDLIISMPGISEQILIECKAKKKINKKDFEQVIFYRQHFGISDCYLINFRHNPEVLRLKKDDVDTAVRKTATTPVKHKTATPIKCKK